MKIIREIIALPIFFVGWTIVFLSMVIGGKEYSKELMKILKDEIK